MERGAYARNSTRALTTLIIYQTRIQNNCAQMFEINQVLIIHIYINRASKNLKMIDGGKKSKWEY